MGGWEINFFFFNSLITKTTLLPISPLTLPDFESIFRAYSEHIISKDLETKKFRNLIKKLSFAFGFLFFKLEKSVSKVGYQLESGLSLGKGLQTLKDLYFFDISLDPASYANLRMCFFLLNKNVLDELLPNHFIEGGKLDSKEDKIGRIEETSDEFSSSEESEEELDELSSPDNE